MNVLEKFRLTLFAILSILAMSVQAQGSQKASDPYLELAPEQLYFSSYSGTQSVSIAANVDWVATSDVSWMTVENGSGNGNGSFYITAAPNDGFDTRTCSVTVSGGGLVRTVTVTQLGDWIYLTVNPISLNFQKDGETLYVDVASNTAWTASSNYTWLTVENGSGNGDGSFSVTVDPFDGFDHRRGTIIVSCHGLQSIVDVIQLGTTNAVDEVMESDVVRIEGDRMIAQVNSPSPALIRVYAITGQMVRSVSLAASCTFEEELPLEGLSAGIYIVRCQVGSECTQLKISVR